MKELFETFAPSGCEMQMRKLLKRRLKGKFDELLIDNMGNLIARNGEGGMCIECGMDNIGVMVVSKEADGVRFSPVGEFKAKAAVGKTVVFDCGTSGTICCDEEKSIDDAKFSDLYLKIDSNKVEIGDFGMISAEFEADECAFLGYNLGNRIGLAAVCNALEEVEEMQNVTVLFSAQKRLGGRGLSAYFKVNSFNRIITVDKSDADGCTIVAKDVRAVSNPDLRISLSDIAEKKDILAETVVSNQNFFLESIAVSCGDPCVAVGIGVMHECGEKERVNKSDFNAAVSLLMELLKAEK